LGFESLRGSQEELSSPWHFLFWPSFLIIEPSCPCLGVSGASGTPGYNRLMLAILGAVLLGAPPVVRSAVVDTVLEAAAPDNNSGREFYSITGPGRTLLISDLSLGNVGRRGRVIESGSLEFFVISGEPKVAAVSLISKPWREGAGSQIAMTPATTGATWRKTGKGLPWQAVGASGPEDSTPLQGWVVKEEGGKITLDGLGPALAKIAQGDPQAHGLRIEFTGEGRVGSADTPGMSPRFRWEETAYPDSRASLVVEDARVTTIPSRDGENVRVRVRVKNTGKAEAPASQIWASMGGQGGPMAALPVIAPGETTDAALEAVWRGGPLPMETELRIYHTGPGASRGASFYPTGLPVAGAALDVLDELNEVILPLSRFSFSPEGVAERFRLAGPEEVGAIQVAGDPIRDILAQAASFEGLARQSGPGLTPDTRDDRLAIPGVPLTPFGWPSRYEGEPPLPQSGLLGRYEAARLHRLAGEREPVKRARWAPEVPKTLAFRLYDLSGAALSQTSVELYKGVPLPSAKPLYKGKTLGSGSFFMTPALFDPPQEAFYTPEDLSGGFYTLVVGEGEARESLIVPFWSLAAEAARGPIPAITLEIRVPLAGGPIDREVNFALNRPVEDSAGRFPGQLAALVDGSMATAVELASNEDGAVWIELDLGRDRLVGEIELAWQGALPGGLTIQHYGTSQTPGVAVTWVKDLAPVLRSADGVSTAYRGPTRTMRYLRIAVTQGGTAKLAEIRVRPLRPRPEPLPADPVGGPGSVANPPR
jgi:hypothetical protein